ncbi:hypothetical protein KALB_4677 [Kutzneria albida DSM 43870]|uniref:Bacteriocin fulvocin C-related protein n=2 Tax=Kutzneria TaxID=43356 RepID=W5WIP2_9PSEU|nr:hypothetical protein KALB_4677 [Kutzneria albida DSM 43870]
MNVPEMRWILAFDASCEKCLKISSAVAQACDGKLELLPLAHPDVGRWREQSLGSQAPWTPTLIKVQADKIRSWTGTAMGIPLACRLGPRSTMRVLRSLGQLRRQAGEHPSEEGAGERTVGRKKFLQLGTGIAVVAGMILAGRTTAFAERKCATIDSWIEANKERLPEHYDAIIAYPMEYRMAIFSALSTESKSRFWLEHLNRYCTTHPGLTAEQVKVLDSATAIAGTQSTFERTLDPDMSRRLGDLKEAAVEAFGYNEARALIATLGPPDESAASRASLLDKPSCQCSDRDNWCSNNQYCGKTNNCQRHKGCGSLGLYVCNGLCKNP